ncbi:MAG: 5-methyltetrahydropteroyltriglutamate--homocysteine S-methyltransferase [Sporolactobacillus sp.]
MSELTTTLKKGPFAADQVGSLLRPQAIKDARAQFKAGALTKEQLRAVEDEEIRKIVQRQKDIGLTAITDGEFRRGWWHLDFLEHLIGVEGYEGAGGYRFAGKTTSAHQVRVVGNIDFDDSHPFLRDFDFLQKAVGVGPYVAKQTIPSPGMLGRYNYFDESCYSDEKAYFTDLGLAYRKAIRAFYEHGCRYLQLDDTNWAYLCSSEKREEVRKDGRDPDHLARECARAINLALEGKPDDLTVTMHICRGNFNSSWIFSGGYEPVADILFGTVKVDGFFLEYDSERAGDFQPLRYAEREDLKIVLGLITSKFPELENTGTIKARIREAARFVPLERLALSPQCGFASTEEGNILTETDQWNKLGWVVTLAQQVWDYERPVE